MVDAAVAGGAGGSVGAGVAVVEALLAGHGGEVPVPSHRALVVAENLGDVVVGVAHGAGPGLVVHVAPLHLGEGVGSYLGQPDGPRGDGIGRGEVKFGEAGLDVEGVQSEVEVGGDDVRGDGGLQGGGVVVGGGDDPVVEVVVAQGFDGGFVEDDPGEAGVPDPHVGGGGDGDPIVAAVDEVEVEVEVDGGVVGPEVDVVHEGEEDVLMGGVEDDPRRPGEVDVVLQSKAGGAVPVDSLRG